MNLEKKRFKKPPKQDRKFKRQCIICREYKQKEDLIRLTRDYKTGIFQINNDNKINGRSIYLCRNQDCVLKFAANKKMPQISDLCTIDF